MSGRPLEETGRRRARASRHYLDATSGEFVANGLTEVEDESLGRGIGRHIGNRLKAGVGRNVDNAAFTSGGHCFAKMMSESDERLNIDLNFSSLLLGIM